MKQSRLIILEANGDKVKDNTECLDIITKKVEEKNKTLVEKIEKLEAKAKREDKISVKCSQCNFEEVYRPRVM